MAPVTPSLPAYAHVTTEAVQCIADASVRYQVPELLLHAVLRKENGRTGKAVRNSNGTYDMGMAQINTVWVRHFARYGIRIEHLLYDTCTNLHASAYILKDNANKFQGDWFKAIIAYNIGPYNWTPKRYAIGHRYASDVVKNWWGFQNWVDGSRAIVRTTVPAYAQTAPAPTSRARMAGQQIVSTPPSFTPAE
jgi:soluble lytic murein transglycosylase-like protein